jgi:hypothetical protein
MWPWRILFGGFSSILKRGSFDRLCLSAGGSLANQEAETVMTQ